MTAEHAPTRGLWAPAAVGNPPECTPCPEVLPAQRAAGRADHSRCRRAARCRPSAPSPSATARPARPSARPSPNSSSRAGCSASRARAPSSPSRRSRRSSSSSATPRTCGTTASSPRPASSTSATSRADERLAGLLGIRPGGRVLRIHRLRLADGEPMSIDTSHLPARRFPGLRKELPAPPLPVRDPRHRLRRPPRRGRRDHRDRPGHPLRRPAPGRRRRPPAAPAVPPRLRHHRRTRRMGPVFLPRRPLQVHHPPAPLTAPDGDAGALTASCSAP